MFVFFFQQLILYLVIFYIFYKSLQITENYYNAKMAKTNKQPSLFSKFIQ